MHLAYSAINTTVINQFQQTAIERQQPNSELIIRYEAYKTTCDKYSREIAAIQKYMPGWEPKFL